MHFFLDKVRKLGSELYKNKRETGAVYISIIEKGIYNYKRDKND